MALFLTHRQVWWWWQITSAGKYNVAACLDLWKHVIEQGCGVGTWFLAYRRRITCSKAEDIRSSIVCFGFECLPRSEAPCCQLSGDVAGTHAGSDRAGKAFIRIRRVEVLSSFMPMTRIQVSPQCNSLRSIGPAAGRTSIWSSRRSSLPFHGFQLPTSWAPRMKPSWISVSRVRALHMTVFLGGGSFARAR